MGKHFVIESTATDLFPDAYRVLIAEEVMQHSLKPTADIYTDHILYIFETLLWHVTKMSVCLGYVRQGKFICRAQFVHKAIQSAM